MSRTCVLAVALLLPAASGAAAGFRFGVGVESQQWRESAGDGRRLLDESGRLPRLEAGWSGELASLGSGPLELALEASLARGVRSYRGMSSSGAPLSTRVDVQHGQLRAALAWPFAQAAQSSWAVTAAVEAGWWMRDLRGVGNVQGYPERYRQLAVAPGLRLTAGAWTWTAEWGTGPSGRNRVRLPGRDPADLPLGRLQALRIAGEVDLGTDWRLGTAWRRTSLAAGDARPVTVQGLPVQSARQPSTQWRALDLVLSRGF